MNPNIHVFIYLLAGITLAFASVSLIIGLQKGSEKTYLFLGLMGICVGIYYLLFPQITNVAPFSLSSKVAFFFFLTNFALLPWFLSYYTGYYRFKVQWLLSAGMVISYVVLLFTVNFEKPIIWNLLGHIVLLAILVFGFRAGLYQRKKGEKRSSLFLLGALLLFSLLTIDDIFRIHFTSIYPFNLPDEILPFDYFLVFFMIIMGLKLARDMQHKYYLEKSVNLQERRWATLLEKVQLLVVGVEKDGIVNYVNPYYLELTGFEKNSIVGKHYINLVPSNERASLEKFANSIASPGDLKFYNNLIKTNSGESRSIAWSLVGIYDSDGNLKSSISIGSDITDQEKAFEEIKELKSKLEEENILLRSELGKVPKVGKITGKGDAIRYVLQRALQVAPTDSTVLLEGETGVGKELVANYIQQNSERSNQKFIKINCASIPGTLLESELFGHLKGAFTGADNNKKGMVEMADGGTLFLDEIGEFPLDLQPKLLRFLQEGEFVPLGSESARRVDVRIIAATNKVLLTEIEKGNFRNDLYYRLYVYPITIPPLRNRIEDIPELIDVFVKQFSVKYRKQITKVSKLVIEELKKYTWPGNIRELENMIERAVIISNSDTLKVKDLSLVIENSRNSKNKQNSKITTLEDAEREHILKALKLTEWQIHGTSGAAEILGINPSTLRSRMKKLHITKP